jgi:hypothetical protein
MEIGNIRELAAKTVECFDDDNVENAAIEVGQQLLVSGTEARRTTGRGIGIGADNCPSLFVDIPRAHLDLIRDRGLTLVLGTISCVEPRAHSYALH